MAEVFRAPLIDRPEARARRDRPLVDDPGVNLLTSTQSTDPPFYQTDWPIPRKRNRPHDDTNENPNLLQDSLNIPLTFHTEDYFPVPRLRRYPVVPVAVAGDMPIWINAVCTDGVPSFGTFIRSGPASATFVEPDTSTSTMAGSATFAQTYGASSTFIVRAC